MVERSGGVALADVKRGLPPGFIKAGYSYTDMGLFTPLSNDFSAQIAKLKAANCDVVTGVFLPPDFATFWAQCAQQGYKPKAATIAKALLFPASIEAIGDRGIDSHLKNGGRRIIPSSPDSRGRRRPSFARPSPRRRENSGCSPSASNMRCSKSPSIF